MSWKNDQFGAAISARLRPAVSEADKEWHYNMHSKVLSKEFVSVPDWKRYSDLHQSLYLERQQLRLQEQKKQEFIQDYGKKLEAQLEAKQAMQDNKSESLTEFHKRREAEEQQYQKQQLKSQAIPQHEPGAKLDQDKLLPHLVLGTFAPALQEVVKVGTFGAIKYTENGWLSVPNGINRYSNAGERHRLTADLEGVESTDKESTISHLAHKIWNDLAVLTLLLNSGIVFPADTTKVIEAAKKSAAS